MTSYALQDLIRVRQHREEQASQAVTVARRRWQEASELVARKQRELADYGAWRVTEETRLLDSLLERPLRMGEITDVRQMIGLLRDREFALTDELRQAESAETKAKAALEEARQKHTKAVRDLEKLTEHRQLWLQERAREQEAAEDLELEDFTPPPRERHALTLSAAHERN